jgi:hypothetical protein
LDSQYFWAGHAEHLWNILSALNYSLVNMKHLYE